MTDSCYWDGRTWAGDTRAVQPFRASSVVRVEANDQLYIGHDE
jgi:hypothetical protein